VKAVRNAALKSAGDTRSDETRIDVVRAATANAATRRLRQHIVVPRSERRPAQVEPVAADLSGLPLNNPCGTAPLSAVPFVPPQAPRLRRRSLLRTRVEFRLSFGSRLFYPILCYGTMMVSPGFSSMFWFSFCRR
jgi:hypothetical protein